MKKKNNTRVRLFKLLFPIAAIMIIVSGCHPAPSQMGSLPVAQGPQTPAPSQDLSSTPSSGLTPEPVDWRNNPIFAGMEIREPVVERVPVLLCTYITYTPEEFDTALKRLRPDEPEWEVEQYEYGYGNVISYVLPQEQTQYGMSSSGFYNSYDSISYMHTYESSLGLSPNSERQSETYVPSGIVEGFSFTSEDAVSRAEDLMLKMGIDLSQIELCDLAVYTPHEWITPIHITPEVPGATPYIEEKHQIAKYPSYFITYQQYIRGLPVAHMQYETNGASLFEIGAAIAMTEPSYFISVSLLREISMEKEISFLSFEEFMSEHAPNGLKTWHTVYMKANNLSFESAELMYAQVPVSSPEFRVRLVPAWCFKMKDIQGYLRYAIFDAVTGKYIPDSHY